MTQRILLNDGTIYEDASCSENGYEMWLFVKGNLNKIFTDFTDPTKTMIIRSEISRATQSELEEKSYAGYTIFTALLIDNPVSGIINIRLRKQV